MKRFTTKRRKIMHNNAVISYLAANSTMCICRVLVKENVILNFSTKKRRYAGVQEQNL
uniref:Uncharacterized protein n=1 Tax=Arundo donax TaxID=35708 RepID=A0A0A9B2A1_ARUDO